MKVLNKLTINNLKLNKKRTAVTIIGIILSTALICAVAGVFSSFQETLKNAVIEDVGDFHVTFNDVPENKLKYIINNRKVDTFFYTQGVGYAKLEKSENEYKPYLYLMEYDESALKNRGVKLKEGRLPKNSNEVIISEHIESNGNVKYNLGDKLNLDICRRMSDGNILNQSNPYIYNEYDEKTGNAIQEENNETLEHIENRELTVVGIMKRPDYNMENYESPGYTIITLMDNIKEKVNVAVKLKNIRDTYEFTKEIQEVKDIDDIDRGKYDIEMNTELLMWSGVARSDSTTAVLYGLMAVVIGIIIVASVFVIRNGFAISVSERMKQIGMIVSVGSTRKQIKKSVSFEGVILGLIGIPLGILSGILATYILVVFSQWMIGDMLNGARFLFKIPLEAIIFSIVLAIITIYLSTRAAARRASKVSPIEAIRSNNEIKIKAKKIKSPKIIKKIFGMGGDIAYKNLKRNRSKYRTTLISLVVSITIFISLSTFMNYAFDLTGLYVTDVNYSVMMYMNRGKETQEEYLDKINEIIKTEGVKDYSIKRSLYMTEDKNISNYITEEGKKYYEKIYGGNPVINLISIGEKPYKQLLSKLNINYEDAKDKAVFIEIGKKSYNKKQIDVMSVKENDLIEGMISENSKNVSLEVIKVTTERPVGVMETDYPQIIVSDEFFEKIASKENMENSSIFVKTEDANEFEKSITQNEKLKGIEVMNYEELANQQKRIMIWVSVFLYGFIIVITLIGVTNIFNTITTNMNLRSKEFAMLKSIGMTKKEFNRMINLESIFYGTKSLIIGNILGIAFSYVIYKITTNSMDFGFKLPIQAIIISIIFVMCIVGIIMKYSLSKINKQNIIETIRKDNI